MIKTCFMQYLIKGFYVSPWNCFSSMWRCFWSHGFTLTDSRWTERKKLHIIAVSHSTYEVTFAVTANWFYWFHNIKQVENRSSFFSKVICLSKTAHSITIYSISNTVYRSVCFSIVKLSVVVCSLVMQDRYLHRFLRENSVSV